MSALPARSKAAILRVADTFTVSGNTRSGWFRICGYGRALLYATPAEVDTYPRPLRLLTVPHDDVTAVGDTVSWNGLTLTVKKAVDIRLRNESVARLLVIA